MPRYPKKDVGQFSGPPWRVYPPSAGTYVPGAGSRKAQQLEDFQSFMGSFATIGAKLGQEVSNENVAKAQNFVKENEKLFRKLEKEGTLDWTPPMMQAAWATSGQLAGREFNTTYKVRMGNLTEEEKQDIEIPQKIYREMLDSHIKTDPRRNTWFDDGFNTEAIDKGKAFVGAYTEAAAKAKKAQFIREMGIVTANTTIDALSPIVDMDPSSTGYKDAKKKAIKDLRDKLKIKIDGTGEDTDSGTVDTGWFGGGGWTANNNEGARTVLQAVLSIGANGEYDPSIVLDVFKDFEVGKGTDKKFDQIEEVKLALADYKSKLPARQEAWEGRKRSKFWRDRNGQMLEANNIFESYQNNKTTQGEANTAIGTWFTEERRLLHEHFGLTPPNAGWKYTDNALFNERAEKIQNKYILIKNQIETQQQLNSAIEPTEAEIMALMEGAESALGGRVDLLISGDPTTKTLGLLEGGRNTAAHYTNRIDTLARELENNLDPNSFRKNSKGLRIGFEGAREYISARLYQRLYEGNEGNPEEQAKFAIYLAYQGSEIQSLLGARIGRDMDLLSFHRSAIKAASVDSLTDPIQRSVATGYEELQQDPGEGVTREVLGDDSSIVRSFNVYSIIRESAGSEGVAQILGIKDTALAAVFDAAWRLRANEAPAGSRLAEAATRIRLRDLGGDRPITDAAKAVMIREVAGLDEDAAEIATTLLREVYVKLDKNEYNSEASPMALKKWARRNIGQGKDQDGNRVFFRIGEPEIFNEYFDETEFYTKFAEDLADVVDDKARIRVELTVLRVGGKTQVIPRGVNKKTGEKIDLFDTNIKSMYSKDDIKYFLDSYTQIEIHKEHTEKVEKEGTRLKQAKASAIHKSPLIQTDEDKRLLGEDLKERGTMPQ